MNDYVSFSELFMFTSMIFGIITCIIVVLTYLNKKK